MTVLGVEMDQPETAGTAISLREAKAAVLKQTAQTLGGAIGAAPAGAAVVSNIQPQQLKQLRLTPPEQTPCRGTQPRARSPVPSQLS